MRAGAALARITPGVGVAMGGYGARQGVATGVHDDLCARTLVLDDGASRVALTVCDLVAVSTDIVESARNLIEAECGIPPTNVCIAATHTHSGPGTLRPKDGGGYVETTARQICGSVLLALADMREVTLKAATAEVATVGQNRRDPEGPRETRVGVLLCDPGQGAPVVASVIDFACHATVLEHDNLDWSADFPGVATREMERMLGGVSVYVQGCCGDVNPVWMRHDFADVARVGGIVATAAARAAHEARPLGEGQWGINLSWSEEIEEPARGSLLSGVGLAAQSIRVTLPRKAPADRDEVDVELAALEGDGSRQARERVNELRMVRLLAGLRSAGGRSEEVEIQAFRIADGCALVALPGEFFVETGRAIRAQAAEAGIGHLILAGYANGYVGYVPPAHAYPRGGYEVGISRFAPEAEAIVVREAVNVVNALERAGGGRA